MKPSVDAFALIRKCSDRNQTEWIDISSISMVISQCADKGKETKRKIPLWDKDNPMVRLSRVRITEC